MIFPTSVLFLSCLGLCLAYSLGCAKHSRESNKKCDCHDWNTDASASEDGDPERTADFILCNLSYRKLATTIGAEPVDP
jgi:hypothetical protein